MKRILSVLLSAAMVFCCVSVAVGSAAGSPAGLYSMYQNDMLFQRDKPLVIKGFAPAGTQVNAALYLGQTAVRAAVASAAADGTFAVTLDGVRGGYDEYTLVMSAGGTEFARLTGVVFGELWIANGQSNMQLELVYTPDGNAKLKEGLSDPYMRVFLEPVLPAANGKYSDYPDTEMAQTEGAYWYRGDNTERLASMSAVAYFFAESLRERLDMPVGILNVAIGGSSIRAWLSAGAIDAAGMRAAAGYPVTYDNTDTMGLYDVSRAYNVKVAPLRVFNVAGMIWYQGESDIGEPEGRYADYLNLLRRDYSEQFGFEGDTMPLIYSHIAPYYYGKNLDELGSFAKDLTTAFEREPQYMSQITIYDLPLDFDFSPYTGSGGSHPIHPITKSPIGCRMADAAYKLVYGAQGAYTSPVLASSRLEGKYVYTTLSHVGDGLMKNGGGELYGFAVCGGDGRYVEAKAELVSRDTVRIWSDYVSEPVAATYGYSLINSNANLFSREGGRALLPAVPFRTADLDGAVYYQNKDWLSCDFARTFHYTGEVDDYYDTWEIASLDGCRAELSFDTSDKFSGASSLAIDFRTYSPLNRSFTVAPVLSGMTDDKVIRSFRDIQTDYSYYDTFSFKVKNTSGRDIALSALKITTNSGLVFAPAVAGTLSTGTVIKSSDEWQTVTFSLAKLYLAGDMMSYALNGSDALRDVKGFALEFADSSTGKGALRLDSFELGTVGTAQKSTLGRNLSLLLTQLMRVVNAVVRVQVRLFNSVVSLLLGR